MVSTINQAANITWGAPTKISADTDVSLNGSLIRAINATPTNTSLAINVTLNGVTFVAAQKTGTAAYTAPGGDVFVPIDASGVGPGTFQSFAQGSVAPFTTLSAAYTNLLATAYWNDGTDIGNTWALSTGYNWTLTNLVTGRTYELQIWVNDSRLNNLSQNNPDLFTTFMDLNGNSVSLQHNVDNYLGGVGQFVIGTFTADATSQALKFIGGNTVGADTSGNNATSLLNAYQLREVTAPSAPVFTSAALAGTNLILQGSNGSANSAYQMLRSTNVTAPVVVWPAIGTNNFDASGHFSFTSSFSAGAAAAFYRVRVGTNGAASPPDITSSPQDLTIAVGQNAVFNVTATGTAPLTYRWFFNTNTLLVSGANPTLTVTNAQLTNAGKYSVTVTNGVGTTNSVFATLTVNPSNGTPDFSMIGWATQGGGTTGGQGGVTNTVSTLSELLAVLSDSTPRIINVSGMIDTGLGYTPVGASKTIIGVGTNSGFIGNLRCVSVNNVIFRNLKFTNPNGGGEGDGLTLRTSTRIFVDHCYFTQCADGELDIVTGSDYVTVSWCKFDYASDTGHDLVNLIGNDDASSALDSGKLHVTMHHNWYGSLCQDRMPRVRYGQVHVFNTYFNSSNNNYCIGVGCSSQIRVEGNYFDAVNNPWKEPATPATNCTPFLIHWNSDNVFTNGTTIPTFAPNSTNVFVPPYAYTLDGGGSVKSTVTNYAGAGKGPFAP